MQNLSASFILSVRFPPVQTFRLSFNPGHPHLSAKLSSVLIVGFYASTVVLGAAGPERKGRKVGWRVLMTIGGQENPLDYWAREWGNLEIVRNSRGQTAGDLRWGLDL